jgi:hypothetical protein
VQFAGFGFQLNSLYLGKCHIRFSCPCVVFFFKSSLIKRTSLKFGVGECVAGKYLNVFYSKTKRGHYTNKGTTLPVKVSSVPILYRSLLP